VELRHLRYFVAVAEELHFGRAAARLSMAQPPLSQQIRQLERELGFPLFERNRSMVRLTDAGRSFLFDARRLLANLQESVARAQLASGGNMGQLKIGVVGSPKVALIRAVDSYKDRTSIRISIEEITFDELIVAIYEGRIDVGVFRQWMPTAAIHTDIIDTGRLSVALPSTHNLAANDVVRFADLAGEDFVTFKRTIVPGYLERLSMTCAEAGFVPKIAREVLSAHSALCFVAAGAVVAVVPSATSQLSFPGVIYRPLVEPDVEVPIVAAWRPESISAVVRDFIDVVSSATA
jgi:DNA-binding transcriptional LysR family regulator